jgi:hypothetical protein
LQIKVDAAKAKKKIMPVVQHQHQQKVQKVVPVEITPPNDPIVKVTTPEPNSIHSE